ncbi:MAG: cold shock protein [Actinomycetota bacterium]|jgi:cold shock CspA family protein|nr:cold shock protein [Actinomycetota bacterium]
MPAGVVADFDEKKGYGTMRADDDGRELFFHCTQIADGTRTITVGTHVTFDVVAGHLGRWEATAITPTSTARPFAQ